MRFSTSAFSLPLLALLAGALLLTAGCDSGGDPARDLGQNTAFSFAAQADTVAEGDDGAEDYSLQVQIDDPGFEENSVEVVFDEAASTLDRSELVGFSDAAMTVQFEESATSGQTLPVVFSIEDDDLYDEGDETAVFRLQSPGSGSASEESFTLVITEDDNSTAIAEARDLEDGETVAVTGVVTRLEGINARIQDESGEDGASGITVRADTLANALEDGDVSFGDRIVAIGELGTFRGLKQISSDVRFQVAEEDAGLPEPQTVTLEDLNEDGEAYESEVVRIENLFFADPGGTFEGGTTYTVQDASGTTFDLRLQGSVGDAFGGVAIPSGAFTFEGILGQFTFSGSGGYQLIPTQPSDVASTGSGARFSFAGSSYALAYETGGDAASVTVRARGLTDGQTASVTLSAGDAGESELVGGATRELTFTGPSPATQTVSLEAVADGESEGVEPLQLSLSTDDGVADAGGPTLWLLDDPTAQTALFDGASGASLISQLQDVYGTPSTFDDYGEARDTLYAAVYNDDGIVRGFYTGYEATLGSGDPSSTLFDQDVNAEHTFPQSRGADSEEPQGRDLHILTPAWAPANQARCNYPYADIDDATTERWFGATGSMGIERDDAPSSSERDAYSESVGNDCGNPSSNGRFEPRESVKGDIARKVLYFRTVWADVADDDFFQEQVATLLQWNEQDPPSAEEARRNVIAASFQGQVVNPFVVDPSLASRAYN